MNSEPESGSEIDLEEVSDGEDEGAKIIKSDKGGEKLLLKGFVYYKSRTVGVKKYWRCNRMKNKECNSTAITTLREEKIEVLKEVQHDHAPNREEVEAEFLKTSLKRKASTHPNMPPAQLLRTELAGVSSGVLAMLPERENLKKMIRRKKQEGHPINPRSLNELGEIPANYRVSLLGDAFLLYDSRQAEEENVEVDEGEEEEEEEDNEEENENVEQNHRVIVFGTRRNIELLMRSNVWFVDGTFKVFISF